MDALSPEKIAQSLGGAKCWRGGQKWSCLCPAHDDHHASLDLQYSADGVVLFKCRAGCSQADVLHKLRARQLWPEAISDDAKTKNGNANGASHKKPAGEDWHPIVPPPDGAPRPTDQQLACDMLHEYLDAKDKLLCYVKRFEKRGDQRKNFFPLTWGVLNGVKSWHGKAVEAPKPLYGLNRLSNAAPGSTVLLCEGEKKADAAQRLFPDHVGMSWMGGSACADKADTTPLNGWPVIVWGDADDAGRKAAAAIAEKIEGARLLDTKGLPDRFDAADLELLDVDDPVAWLKERLPPPELLWREPLDIESAIPRRVYIVPGYIQRGVVTEVVGPAGHGKSLLFLTWAVVLAIGPDAALGSFRPTRPMRVGHLDVEDDLDEQDRRVAAILRMLGKHHCDLGGRLRIMNPSRTGMIFELDPTTRKLRQTGLMIEVLDAIDSFQPDLITLNPLGELHNAEVSDNGALRNVVGELRVLAKRRDIGVLLGHHTRKGVPDHGNPDAGLGASSVGGVVRKSFTLFEMTRGEAASWKIPDPERFFRLDGAKANYDRKNPVEWFERKLHTLDNGDSAVAPMQWFAPFEAITDKEIAALMNAVMDGDFGQPWTKRLGKYDRSISRAMDKVGISSKDGQLKTLELLLAAGCHECSFTNANRKTAVGLRHPSGAPNVAWLV